MVDLSTLLELFGPPAPHLPRTDRQQLDVVPRHIAPVGDPYRTAPAADLPPRVRGLCPWCQRELRFDFSDTTVVCACGASSATEALRMPVPARAPSDSPGTAAEITGLSKPDLGVWLTLLFAALLGFGVVGILEMIGG